MTQLIEGIFMLGLLLLIPVIGIAVIVFAPVWVTLLLALWVMLKLLKEI